MSTRTRYKRCPRCRRKRPIQTFWGKKRQICRVCGKEARAKTHGREDVVEVIRAYGDLDVPLTNALGVQWPHTLLKAAEGRYARV